MATPEQLRAAGFSDAEILADAGFSPEEIGSASIPATPTRQYSNSEMALVPFINMIDTATLGIPMKATAAGSAGIQKLASLLSGEASPSFKDMYAANVEGVRDAQKAFASESPIGSAVSSAAGIPMNLRALPQVTMAAGSGVKPAFARIAQAIGIGAPMGALQGAGSADPGQELEGAKGGAKYGALVSGLLQGGGEVARPLLNSLVGMYRKSATGMGSGDITKGFRRGSELVDDAGNQAAGLADAAQEISAADVHLKTVAEDGLFAKLANKPETAKVQVRKRLSELGDDITDLLDLTKDKVAPVQPDLTQPMKLINKIDLTKPTLGNALRDDMADAVNGFLKSKRTLADMVETKQSLDAMKSLFTDTKSASENATGRVYRMIYGAFKDAAEKSFDQLVPSKAGAFKKSNELYEAYSAVNESLAHRAGLRGVRDVIDQGVGMKQLVSLLGAGGGALYGNPAAAAGLTAGSALGVAGRLAPATAARGYQSLADALTPMTTGPMGGIIGGKLQ